MCATCEIRYTRDNPPRLLFSQVSARGTIKLRPGIVGIIIFISLYRSRHCNFARKQLKPWKHLFMISCYVEKMCWKWKIIIITIWFWNVLLVYSLDYLSIYLAIFTWTFIEEWNLDGNWNSNNFRIVILIWYFNNYM